MAILRFLIQTFYGSDGCFRYRQQGMNLPYFIYYVGGPSWKCPVALSTPFKFHDHSEKNNSEESSGDEGIASYIPTIAYSRMLTILVQQKH